MKYRSTLSLLGLLAISTFASCTSTYQQMLHDRDLKIGQLENANAQLRAANRDLERREKTSRDESDALRGQLANAVVDASARTSEVQSVQSELSDLDVGYRRGRVSIGIDNEVTFASGSITLRDTGGDVLRRVASVLKRRYPDRRIYVEGHTDSDPIRKTKGRFRSNRHLSAERADVVAEYLVEKCGLPPDRVVVVGFGEHDPKVNSGGESAKAKNRRVETVVGDPM